MMKGLDDVLFSLSIAAVLIFFLWAAMVAPIRSQERIAMKALEVYRLELDAGIKKENSQARLLLEALGEADKIKEHDHGDDQR
ncbi:hypothetical protein [Desulfovibrio sp.]|uniref:hypothetical protein n=1 Tax=Desulfovibrio sp. TaxID=885 RepID=UPI003AF4E1F7